MTGRTRLREIAAEVDRLLQPPTPFEAPPILSRNGEEICRDAVSMNLLAPGEIEGACDDRLILKGLRVAFSRRFRDVLTPRSPEASQASQDLVWAEEVLRFVKGLML